MNAWSKLITCAAVVGVDFTCTDLYGGRSVMVVPTLLLTSEAAVALTQSAKAGATVRANNVAFIDALAAAL
jgi:hypothetical protein